MTASFTEDCVSSIVNIMAADALATEGARASASMILNQFSRNYSRRCHQMGGTGLLMLMLCWTMIPFVSECLIPYGAYCYNEWHLLAHLLLDKVAAISQTIISDAFSWTKMIEFRFEFHWNLFPFGLGNGLAPNGDKTLPEPMLTRFTDAYMRPKGEMSCICCHQIPESYSGNNHG